MLALIALLLCAAAIREIARRRGSSGCLFAIASVAGHIVFGTVARIMLGPGPDILVAWGWVGLCYLGVFVLTGGGRRLARPWQCPECQFHTEPTTLVCPCGRLAPSDDVGAAG